MEFGTTGTCVGARLLLGTSSQVALGMERKYMACSDPAAGIGGWDVNKDQLLCWCVTYP